MMKGNWNSFPGSASGFRLQEGNEDSAVDGKLGRRHKSFAGAQVLVKRFVKDKPVQKVWGHAGLFLTPGAQGSSRTGLPWVSTLAQPLLRVG